MSRFLSTFPVTVGTQAAVLAGLDITMFIEFQPPPNSAWVCVQQLILLKDTTPRTERISWLIIFFVSFEL